MHFTSYITEMEGMEENSNSDYMDEMLEYDAVVVTLALILLTPKNL